MKENVRWFLLGIVSVIVLGVVALFIIFATNNVKQYAVVGDAMSPSYSNDMIYDAANEDKYAESAKLTDGAVIGEKVVYTANVSLKTDDYAKNIENVKGLFDMYQAKIANFSENSNKKSDGKQYMYANIKVLVPQNNFKAFTEAIKDCGLYVASYNESSEDITETYMNVESKLSSLKKQEQVLDELLTKAKSVEEILQITNQKQVVIQQIEYNTKLQKTFDNRVEYSNVSITIQEVQASSVVEKGIIDRVKDTALSSIDGLGVLALNLLLLVIYLIPFVLVIAVIVVIVRVIYKAVKKNK